MTRIARVQRDGIERLWDDLYELDPVASPFQSRRWARTMVSMGYWRPAAMAVSFTDGLDAVVPAVTYRLVPGRPAPRLSWPRYWGEAPPLWSGAPDTGHVRGLLRLLADEPAIMTRLSTGPINGSPFAASSGADWHVMLRRSHVIDLSEGFEAAQANFSKGIRYEARRAGRRGVEIRHATDGSLADELIGAFDAAIPRWADKQHEPVWLTRVRGRRRDSPRKIRAIARGMGQDCLLTIATLHGRAIGGSLALRGRNPEALLNPIDPVEGLKAGASQAIYSEVVRVMCEDKGAWFNLGESGFEGGLATYKERYGAVARDHVDLYRERLPFTATEQFAKNVVKRLVGFQD